MPVQPAEPVWRHEVQKQHLCGDALLLGVARQVGALAALVPAAEHHHRPPAAPAEFDQCLLHAQVVLVGPEVGGVEQVVLVRHVVAAAVGAVVRCLGAEQRRRRKGHRQQPFARDAVALHHEGREAGRVGQRQHGRVHQGEVVAVAQRSRMEPAHLGELRLLGMAQVPQGGDVVEAHGRRRQPARRGQVDQVAAQTDQLRLETQHPPEPMLQALPEAQGVQRREEPVGQGQGDPARIEAERGQHRQVGLHGGDDEQLVAPRAQPLHLQHRVERLAEAAPGGRLLVEHRDDLHRRLDAQSSARCSASATRSICSSPSARPLGR